MKIKLILSFSVFMVFYQTSFAQLSTIVDDFVPSLKAGQVELYIRNTQQNINYLKGVEKNTAEKILTLFKVLSGKEQSMNIIEFNHAMRQVGLNYYRVLQMNSDLDLIQVTFGQRRSILVFNNSENMYRFSLKGTGGVTTSNYSQTFNGGVFEYHCRYISYDTKQYKYQLTSIEKLKGI